MTSNEKEQQRTEFMLGDAPAYLATRFNRRTLLARSMGLGFATILAGGLLAACGGDDDDDEEEPTAESDSGSGDTEATASSDDEEQQDDTTADEDESSEDDEPTTNGGDSTTRELPTGDIVFVEGTDVTAFDPQIISDTPTVSMAWLLYDSLVRYDVELNVEPQLAQSWEISDDQLTWTFKLQEGVTFWDGTPLTADDVVYTMDRLRDEATGATYRTNYLIIEEVTAVDDLTVEFRTSAPFPDLLINLTGTGGAVLSRAYAEGSTPDEYGRDPLGSGPFMIEEWVPGEHCTLVVNPNYWGELPGAERIIYRPVPEAATRTAMMLAGEADIVVKLSPEDVPTLEGDSDIVVHDLDSMYQVSFEITVTHEDPPLNIKEVRQALNYAVDKQAIIDNILLGYGQPMVSPFGPGIQFRVELEPYEYDPDRAKQLLADAGYPDGFSIMLWSPDGRYLKDRQVAEAVQGYLSEIGLDVELRFFEWAAYQAARAEDDSMQLAMVGRATAGADYTATRLFSRDAAANTTGFWLPEIEELLVEGRTTFDEEERQRIYARIQELWWENAVWLFLHNQRSLVATRSNIEGYELTPTEVSILRNVRKV